MRGNILKIHLTRGRIGQSGTLSQWDRGQRLIITGCELPDLYEVHFSNEELGLSKTAIGDSSGVDIPDEFLQSGKDIHVWVYGVDETHAETEYHGLIKVIPRARPTDIDPDPVQKTTIDRAIEMLETAVVQTEENVKKYPYINEDGYWMAYDAELGEFVNTGVKGRGEDGDPTTLIDDTAGDGITDKTWSADKLVDEFDLKATKANPEFTGSVSMGRVPGSTVGNGSSAVGSDVTASGPNSHAEGGGTTASGWQSHAEGAGTVASGMQSHAEGGGTTASGTQAHAEGAGTVARGYNSHAEGLATIANKDCQHVFGRHNAQDTAETEFGTFVEIVGNGTSANRANARTLDWEGNERLAGDLYVHADADGTDGNKVLSEDMVGIPNGLASLDDAGRIAASQLPSYVDDVEEYASMSEFPETGESGKIYVAEDTNMTYRWSGSSYVAIKGDLALGETESTAYRGDRGKIAYDHASLKGKGYKSGLYKIATNEEGHVSDAIAVTKKDITDLGIPGDISTKAEKSGTILDTTLSMGRKASTTIGARSTALGYNVTARGNNSFATGNTTSALGNQAHAEGNNSSAIGDNSHAEGLNGYASGNQSHAEGGNSKATGNQAHAEGSTTTASGTNAHSEGLAATASGYNSHAEGNTTTASGTNSHAEGYNTKAKNKSQHVGGEYNVEDPSSNVASERGTFVEIIGNGEEDFLRSNARALDWEGNEYLSGDLYVNCNDDSTGGNKVMIEPSVQGTAGQVLTSDGNGGQSWQDPTGGGTVTDVQVNGTSVLNGQGVANVPVADQSVLGVVQLNRLYGIGAVGNGFIGINKADDNMIKTGTENNRPIVPSNTHTSVFYGLAKAAGDNTQSQSSNAVGQYTNEAKTAIQNMLGVPDASNVLTVNMKGTANGVASLDSTGKVPSSQLPSYVDDVVEYASLSSFPNPGSSGIIYVALDTNKTYRWSGSEYIEISSVDISGKADKADTVLDTTLSRGRKENTTMGGASLAFGVNTEASGYYSVALGLNTTASSQGAFAEGKDTVAHYIAHAEGEDTQALGQWAHSQGVGTVANGAASFAGGDHTIANGHASFVTGRYNAADSYDNWPTWIANTSYEVGDRVKRNLMVQNKPTDVGYHCTVANSDATFDNAHWELDGYRMNYSVIIGNGYEAEDPETHQIVRHGSNAYALDWEGNEHLAGDIYVNCNNDSTGGTKLTPAEDVVIVSDTQPQSEYNKLWINDDTGNEYSVPTYAEFTTGMNAKIDKPSTAGTAGQVLTSNGNGGQTWEDPTGTVTDVQVNGTSVLDGQGVANVPVGSTSNYGVLKVGSGFVVSNGVFHIFRSYLEHIKAGTEQFRPIVPENQHSSAFYGLAKAAGDNTQSVSSNPVGTYTDSAKEAIKAMFGIQEGLEVVRLA